MMRMLRFDLFSVYGMAFFFFFGKGVNEFMDVFVYGLPSV